MRNSKLNKMIAGCIGFAIVLGICGLFTAEYAVNRFMESFAEGLEADSLEAAKEESPSTTAPKEADVRASEPDNQTPAENEDQPQTSSKSAEAKQEKGGVRPSMPTGTVTKEQVREVQEKLTLSDKATVVSVILKNLSVSDLKQLRIIATRGLTVEEKREAKQLLLAKLSSDDYNELSALAKKYGISRGKSYDEAKQEYNS